MRGRREEERGHPTNYEVTYEEYTNVTKEMPSVNTKNIKLMTNE